MSKHKPGPLTQDWEPVVFKKNPSQLSKADAKRKGLTKTVKRTADNSQLHKVENETETFKIDKVDLNVGKQIQQARCAKKMTQKQLAQAINCQASVITELESGKAKYNPAIINKVKRALGISIKNKKKK